MDKNQRDKVESKQIATEDKTSNPPLSAKDQEKLDHLQKKQTEVNIKQIQSRGYGKLTVEYDKTGQVQKITRESPVRKTWWDWIQLLIIPFVLVGIGYWFTAQQNQTSQQIASANRQQDIEIAATRYANDQHLATDQQQEATLKSYLDDMADLLFNHKLRNSKPEDEVSQIAKERTLTTLRRLNSNRNKIVLQFLQDAHLIGMKNAVIDLRSTDLSGLDLSGVNLSNVDLSGANLSADNLNFANLSNASLNCSNIDGNKVCVDLSLTYLGGTNLSGTDLREANLGYSFLGCKQAGIKEICVNLSGANLTGADLSGTYLRGVTGITSEQLVKEAKSLKGAIMPDGSSHP